MRKLTRTTVPGVGIKRQKRKLLMAMAAMLLGYGANATIYTVTSVDTSRLTTGTLPWAIEQVNAGSGGDEIHFNIAGGGPWVISPRTEMNVNKTVTIDGTTQPGYTSAPLISITGGGGATSGFLVGASNCSFTGLNMGGFNNSAILLFSSNNTVTKCYIGTDITGTSSVANGNGIMIFGSNNVIGGAGAGNLLSGNTNNQLIINTGSDNIVKGNIIGLDVTGASAVSACSYGIFLGANNTIIGGAASGEGNFISGNTIAGIYQGMGNGVTIKGNCVGTDITGTTAVPNGIGIFCGGGGPVAIGGSAIGEGNISSGNTGIGIQLTNGGTGGSVQGNIVGLKAGGIVPLGNGGSGISVTSYSQVTVGGNSAGARNIVSANGSHGIEVFYGGLNKVQGNYVGTDITGTASRGNNGHGVFINATGTLIGGHSSGEGNLIAANALDGIRLFGIYDTVEGNLIGLDVTGNIAMGNGGYGVNVGATNNLVGTGKPGAGNVIAASGSGGIFANGAYHVAKGNYIGTNKTGTAAIPNNGHGIYANGTNGVFGGIGPDEGNLISGNNRSGIHMENCSFMSVKGNIIGMDAAGTVAIANHGYGVYNAGGHDTIGLGVAGARNYISGNDSGGIYTAPNGAQSVIKGNYIGVNKAGTAAIPNNGWGIEVRSSNMWLGGVAAGEGNLVSGNAAGGIKLLISFNELYGNAIGTNAGATSYIPNNGSGIFLATDVAYTTIGGQTAGAGNVIAGNTGTGISIVGSNATKNKISGNSIYGNGGIGIDLDNDGRTANDVNHDPDLGANTLINYPEITSIVHDGGNTIINGTYYGLYNVAMTLEFFANTTAGSGGYQGQTYLGSTTINTDSDGRDTFSVSFPGTHSVVSATATYDDQGTSEFSPADPIFAAESTPTVTVCGTAAIDLKNYLHVSYVASGKTLTWSQAVAPAHGILTVTSATASSGSTDITPGGTISYQATGSYTGRDSVTVQVSDGTVSGTIKVYFVINPAVEITAIGSNTPVCSNGTLNLNSTVTGAGTLSYSWTGPDAFSSNTEDVSVAGTLVSSGVYTLVASNDDGCSDSAATTVAVNPTPKITLADNNGPICAGITLELESQATGGTGTLSFAWTGPNAYAATGSSTSISNAQTTADGTYTVIVTDANSCRDTATTTAVVYPVPFITAISSNAPVCEEKPLSLLSSVTGGTGTIAYSWSGPNGFTAATEDPAITSSATTAADGTYQLIVTDDNSCADTGTTTVTVYPIQPIIGPNTVLFGQTIALSDPIAGGTWSTSMPWTIQVNAGNGNVKGHSAGLSVVSYTTTHGCVATHTISVLSGLNVCVGQTITMSDNGTPGGTWSSGNASIATVVAGTGVLTGVNPGKAVITYRTSPTTAVTTTVTVNALQPTTMSAATACQGQAITLTNNTAGGGSWYSGNTTIAIVSSTGSVSGLNGGIVNIYFAPATGCATVKTLTITAVSPITGSTSVCVGKTTALSNSTPGGNWNSGNGALAGVNSAGLVYGVAPGAPVIYYTWPNGCWASATITVNPLSQINASTGSVVCRGSSIAYTNTTVGGGIWSSANTTIATVSSTGNITGTGSGVTNISFTTGAGCVATRSVTVNGTATISGITTVCMGQTTQLSSSLSGGTWLSSSASLATVSAAGLVKGLSSGAPRISYIMPTGCNSHVTVTVNTLQAITGGTAGMCQSGSMTLANSTPFGGVWSSSNTAAATVNGSGVVRGAGAGVTIISFTSNNSGCVATRTVTVNACRQSEGTDNTAMAETQVMQDIKVFPNPNNGLFTIRGTLMQVTGQATVSIVNTLGQTVYQSAMKVTNGMIEEQIDLGHNLPAGIYLLNIISGGERATVRLTVE